MNKEGEERRRKKVEIKKERRRKETEIKKERKRKKNALSVGLFSLLSVNGASGRDSVIRASREFLSHLVFLLVLILFFSIAFFAPSLSLLVIFVFLLLN